MNVDPLRAECLVIPLIIQSINVPVIVNLVRERGPPDIIAIFVRDPDPPDIVVTPLDPDVLASGLIIEVRVGEANSTEVGIDYPEVFIRAIDCEICRGIEDKRSASALNFTAEGGTTYPSWYRP